MCLLNSSSLTITISEPTKVTLQSSSCVDNICTNLQDTEYTTDVLDPCISDHKAQIFKSASTSLLSKPFYTRRFTEKNVRRLSYKKMYASRKYLTEKELEEIVREIEASQSDDIGFSHDSSDSGSESEDHEEIDDVEEDEIVCSPNENDSSDDEIPLSDLQRKYVLKLSEPIHRTNRNITLDNWSTSVRLTNSLREVGLTVVGTLRKNKPEIPPKFLKPKISTPNRFAFTQDVVLVSHIPRKN
nr:unnamed protein product [Callosobruchus analis]